LKKALGAYLSRIYSDDAVVLLATLIAIIDLLFILFFVPESLNRSTGTGKVIGTASGAAENLGRWRQGFSSDPLFIFRFLRDEQIILQLSAIVFLSYLPEAGQFSCFFVYLRLVSRQPISLFLLFSNQVVGFSPEAVALFIAFIGILSVISQTFFLLLITQKAGPKSAITLGLIFQFIQLVWYGLGSAHWM
jgi:hypothetical protein